MSKNVAVFVDVANLYYAARGQDVDVDYVALLKHATKGRDLIRAYAYSGLDPENENQKKFLDFLGKNGYRVVAKDIRKFGDGRVKANLDIELVVDLFRLADRMDVAVIVSGDGDFAPAIRALQDVGVRCEVISFKPNTSSDLFAVADEFHDAMKISAIGRQKETKGVGAPEMPAKEVNPDVGFREASPSVAAAALAAIRSDGDEPAGRGRGRGTRRPSTAAGRGGRGRTRSADAEPVASASATSEAAAPAAGAPHADNDSDTESGRRRRRRGGRGRGRRGRRGDGPETAESTNGEPAEIRWDEIDSLDELDGTTAVSSPDQELGFAEADAATLAELGLSAQPVGVKDGDDPVGAPAAKPRTRTRSPSTKTAAKAATATTADDGGTTPRRSSSTKASTSAASKPAAKPKSSTAKKTADAAPAKTTRSRAPRAPKGDAAASKADAGRPAGDGSDQGIWQRFTSGRTTKKGTTSEPPTEG
ncbi:MAG TPA: NYN domain-containing protein [Candidatus Limnocylindria bacterium]|nr:NYN domain-containing protein [Candidatus Limnocylindria bacterium]